MVHSIALVQATLFVRSASQDRPRIKLNGVDVVPEVEVFVEVLVPDATQLVGVAGNPFRLTLPGHDAGLFSKGTLTAMGVPGGTTIQVTIRAWKMDSGATYETASVRSSTTFPIVTGDGIDENGIAIIPECIVGPGKFAGLDLQTTATTAPGKPPNRRLTTR